MVGAALRCLVFASREAGPAEERYGRLLALLRQWLPGGWTSTERGNPARSSGIWIAQDARSGTLMSLARSGARIHFLMKRAPA